ncbi:hypothetical protein CVT25_015208 [Psilocybe cyanescens]|uniref:Uncharacterized protein n=1 Tax=Psilocybe cyanescens TaxID=93625 RepID=A0A409WRQ7_PSICY|nr:hypothetical protein CVT25_015208 [Psilocybe cyanescens]
MAEQTQCWLNALTRYHTPLYDAPAPNSSGMPIAALQKMKMHGYRWVSGESCRQLGVEARRPETSLNGTGETGKENDVLPSINSGRHPTLSFGAGKTDMMSWRSLWMGRCITKSRARRGASDS